MADVLRFDTTESRKRTSQSAKARAGRAAMRIWAKHIEHLARDGFLLSVDVRVAAALMNYPSATLHGYSFPKQKTLSEVLGLSKRTVLRSIERMKRARSLHIKQRGKRRSSKYWFCIEGELVISGENCFSSDTGVTSRSDTDGTPKGVRSDTDGTEESVYLIESNNHESPPKPPTSFAPVEPPQGQPSEDPVFSGEVLGPKGDVTFDEFWKAIRTQPGNAGAALAAWRKLSRDDRRAIGERIGQHGLDLDGMWAVTWLKERRWEAPRLSSRMDEALADLNTFIERRGKSHSALAAHWARRAAYVVLEPYSAEWTAERERRLTARESVTLMDSWAQMGRGWSAREGGE